MKKQVAPSVLAPSVEFSTCYLLNEEASGATWLGGLLVERRTSVSQIRGSIPGQVAAV